MKALLLLHTEPALDAANASAARKALAASGLVVALTPFKDVAHDVADVLLPIAPFTETAGSYVNAEGRLQTFHGVAKPLGEARPAWKVLRVLGNLLGLPGFEFETVEAVRAEALPGVASGAGTGTESGAGAGAASIAAAVTAQLDNNAVLPSEIHPPAEPGLQRIADVPIYATDATVRRAPALQATADARAPMVGLPSTLWHQLGLETGGLVLVGQGDSAVVLSAREDNTLAEGVVRIAAGHPSTVGLGAMFGAITVEKV